jgi:uncharacterized membrane protein YidH (DUF202 family)
MELKSSFRLFILSSCVLQIKEDEVQQVLTNTYPIEEKRKEMLAQGKSQKEVDEWENLVREITQICASKQLVPTVRTQCMRTAFQIPFDATVRISLDTNLCMISERGYDLQGMKVWHRDPSWVLQPEEITRFPHAVLEIKLQLSDGNLTPPKWVTELQNSGLLYECHKYSKYVHGCCVLLPEDVRSVPYWVDDASLRDSIIASAGKRILADSDVGVGPGANETYSHLLPFGDVVNDRTQSAVGRTASSKVASLGLIGDRAVKGDGPGLFNDTLLDEEDFLDDSAEGCWSWMFPFCSRNNNYSMAVVAPTSIQKIEPKLFLANERTYLHWLHHGVILSTVASGILAFSDESGEKWGEMYALILLVVSLGFCVYALHVFLWRTAQIRSRIPGRWDDPLGPMLLGAMLTVILACNFATKLYEIAKMSNP